MLTVEGLVGGYGAADEVVKGVGLTVAPGEILTVIGPNGAGKSTALKLVSGLLRCKAGSVRLGESDLSSLDPQGRAREGLVFVPQERNVFGALTIAENLDIGAYLEPARSHERARDVYARFPLLAERRGKAAGALSGGQRQTLAMAIALMASPRVLLLDEPTAALAPKPAAEIFKAIRGLADEGIAILMVEQNALAALAMSDRALVMVDGRVAMDGEAQAMRQDPEVRRAFLGGRA
ncbi:ABC transporter ATP-binding protein [Acuticoccus mangrovi]|uniref:ABC transporter ATP-binding protein n=1 Tax=Acuticoccus mangrovi TaxID=2796142 RepID=A0A934IV92_9HYPH|nr:ABC transporter ATP-binding protein [Acuticoccus mangrovi]MBJ3778359.1 ABC transporter ATP-binding protein [Acuticoccus mangrovi]